MSEEKRCTKCGTAKPLTEFKLQKRKTGHFPTSQCRQCLNESSKLFMREHIKDPEVRARMNEKDKQRYQEVIKKDPERMQKQRARGRAYMQRPDVKARFKEYLREYAKQPGKKALLRKKSQAWVDANREKARAYWRRYYQTDNGRLRHRLQQSKRRALIAGSGGTLTKQDWQRVLAAYDHRCLYCGAGLLKLTVDHFVPIVRGGAHDAGNVVPACLSCNSRKSDAPFRQACERLDFDPMEVMGRREAGLARLLDRAQIGGRV